MIGAAIRKYWPGMYTPIPDGDPKLAYIWEDYEIAPFPGFASAADAVIKKFWVMPTFWVSFLVDYPTMPLTIFLMLDCSAIIGWRLSIRSGQTWSCVQLVGS